MAQKYKEDIKNAENKLKNKFDQEIEDLRA